MNVGSVAFFPENVKNNTCLVNKENQTQDCLIYSWTIYRCIHFKLCIIQSIEASREAEAQNVTVKSTFLWVRFHPRK